MNIILDTGHGWLSVQSQLITWTNVDFLSINLKFVPKDLKAFHSQKCIWKCTQGAVSIRKTVLPGMAIPMLKIRRPLGRLIFNMEIAIRR